MELFESYLELEWFWGKEGGFGFLDYLGIRFRFRSEGGFLGRVCKVRRKVG